MKLTTGFQIIPFHFQNAATAMSSLIHALYEMDTACIARYVWRNSSQPKLVALVPHIKADYEVGVNLLYLTLYISQLSLI